jgi:hypothetical protein
MTPVNARGPQARVEAGLPQTPYQYKEIEQNPAAEAAERSD